MKITCNIIKDILPLYAENIASEDSRKLVDEHFLTCLSCKKALEDMREDNCMELDTDVSAFNLVKIKIRKNKIKTTSFFVIVTLFILTIVFSALTKPNLLPYSKDNIILQKDTSGNVIISFGKNVSDYEISQGYTENGLRCYEITTWNTFLSRNIIKKSAKSFVLNSSDENVDGIRYYSPNTNMIWISNDNQITQIEGIVLPRLVLNVYLLLAIILTLLTGVIYVSLFKFTKIQNIVLKVFYLPLAYVVSSFCIGGLSNSTYSIIRDFSLIVLSTVLLYSVILLGTNLFKENKSLKQ